MHFFRLLMQSSGKWLGYRGYLCNGRQRLACLRKVFGQGCASGPLNRSEAAGNRPEAGNRRMVRVHRRPVAMPNRKVTAKNQAAKAQERTPGWLIPMPERGNHTVLHRNRTQMRANPLPMERCRILQHRRHVPLPPRRTEAEESNAPPIRCRMPGVCNLTATHRHRTVAGSSCTAKVCRHAEMRRRQTVARRTWAENGEDRTVLMARACACDGSCG